MNTAWPGKKVFQRHQVVRQKQVLLGYVFAAPGGHVRSKDLPGCRFGRRGRVDRFGVELGTNGIEDTAVFLDAGERRILGFSDELVAGFREFDVQRFCPGSWYGRAALVAPWASLAVLWVLHLAWASGIVLLLLWIPGRGYLERKAKVDLLSKGYETG